MAIPVIIKVTFQMMLLPDREYVLCSIIVAQKYCYLLTFPLAFPIMVAGITDDLSSPHRPVRLLARSQSKNIAFVLIVFPSSDVSVLCVA